MKNFVITEEEKKSILKLYLNEGKQKGFYLAGVITLSQEQCSEYWKILLKLNDSEESKFMDDITNPNEQIKLIVTGWDIEKENEVERVNNFITKANQKFKIPKQIPVYLVSKKFEGSCDCSLSPERFKFPQNPSDILSTSDVSNRWKIKNIGGMYTIQGPVVSDDKTDMYSQGLKFYAFFLEKYYEKNK